MKINILFLSIILTSMFKIADAQIVYTIAGIGTFGYNGDGISASSAQLAYPNAVEVDTAGNIYIADDYNFRIRKVTPSGVITTIAGTGVSGYSGDGGLATSAMLSSALDVAVDRFGNVYFADNTNHRVRKISTSGIITTIAGTGVSGYNGDGILATTAQLKSPSGVEVDTVGNVYIGDGNNNRIRKINSVGIISTIAGTGVATFAGDGGLATAAQLYAPAKMAFDKYGNLYFADIVNRRIRKITVAGIISTVAGNGSTGYSGDGVPATSASLYNVQGVSVDTLMNIYIADSYNNRVRKVNPSGIISTYVGNGSMGYTGDGGLATSATVHYPTSVANDKYGNLYFPDNFNHCIRKVVATCVAPAPPTSSTSSLNACSGQTKVLSVLDPGLIKWYAFPTGGTVLGTGLNYITPALTADTIFYAATTTCATSATRTAFPLTVYPIPTVTATSGSSICNGTSVTLNGGGASTYAWTGGITDGVAFSPPSTTTYTVTGTSAFGCTGTATSMITVNTPNPSFTASGAVLTAVVSGAGYQWYNCTTSSIIAGATSQAYTITTGGSYALIITQTGCVDTSTCQTITVTGIDNSNSHEFKIYPNPANDLLQIEFGASLKNEAVELKIYNTLGELVFSKTKTTSNSKDLINISTLPAGAYFLNIYSSSTSFKTPLLIQH